MGGVAGPAATTFMGAVKQTYSAMYSASRAMQESAAAAELRRVANLPGDHTSRPLTRLESLPGDHTSPAASGGLSVDGGITMLDDAIGYAENSVSLARNIDEYVASSTVYDNLITAVSMLRDDAHRNFLTAARTVRDTAISMHPFMY